MVYNKGKDCTHHSINIKPLRSSYWNTRCQRDKGTFLLLSWQITKLENINDIAWLLSLSNVELTYTIYIWCKYHTYIQFIMSSLSNYNNFSTPLHCCVSQSLIYNNNYNYHTISRLPSIILHSNVNLVNRNTIQS